MAEKRGRPKNPPKVKTMLKEILPIEDIYTKDELVWYNKLVDVYLGDFDVDDLTSSDMDDIMDLAKNRILEFRLLKVSRDDHGKQVDVSTSIEKLRKQNEKIKESLSTRRRDRVNPNEFKGFSIVDLAVAYDNDRKESLRKKTKKLQKSKAEYREKLDNYRGNRDDLDVREKVKDSI